MQEAYTQLHKQHIAHSIEVWSEEAPAKQSEHISASFNDKQYYLAGGLYGVLTPYVFCGESMFSLMPNASRAGLLYLVQKLQSMGHILIDCQIESPHFIQMGARKIPRKDFLAYLQGKKDDTAN